MHYGRVTDMQAFAIYAFADRGDAGRQLQMRFIERRYTVKSYHACNFFSIIVLLPPHSCGPSVCFRTRSLVSPLP